MKIIFTARYDKWIQISIERYWRIYEWLLIVHRHICHLSQRSVNLRDVRDFTKNFASIRFFMKKKTNYQLKLFMAMMKNVVNVKLIYSKRYRNECNERKMDLSNVDTYLQTKTKSIDSSVGEILLESRHLEKFQALEYPCRCGVRDGYRRCRDTRTLFRWHVNKSSKVKRLEIELA